MDCLRSEDLHLQTAHQEGGDGMIQLSKEPLPYPKEGRL